MTTDFPSLHNKYLSSCQLHKTKPHQFKQTITNISTHKQPLYHFSKPLAQPVYHTTTTVKPLYVLTLSLYFALQSVYTWPSCAFIYSFIYFFPTTHISCYVSSKIILLLSLCCPRYSSLATPTFVFVLSDGMSSHFPLSPPMYGICTTTLVHQVSSYAIINKTTLVSYVSSYAIINNKKQKTKNKHYNIHDQPHHSQTTPTLTIRHHSSSYAGPIQREIK